MKKTLIKNAILVNENKISQKDLLIKGEYIYKIDDYIEDDHNNYELKVTLLNVDSRFRNKIPKNLKRDPSRLFVTFRKNEKIKNELSVTSGHMYKKSSVIAKSGKNEFLFFSQGNFAWLIDGEEGFNLIKTMKRASKLSVTARTSTGMETKDMYSMMGFTKAYNTARKSCA